VQVAERRCSIARELLALSIVMAAAAAAAKPHLYTFEYYTDVCLCIPFTLLFLFFVQTWPPTRWPPCCTLAPECYTYIEEGGGEKEKEQRTGTGTRTRFRLPDRVSCHRELLVDAPIICIRAYTSSGFFEFGELNISVLLYFYHFPFILVWLNSIEK
jgi:hypothetical protein